MIGGEERFERICRQASMRLGYNLGAGRVLLEFFLLIILTLPHLLLFFTFLHSGIYYSNGSF